MRLSSRPSPTYAAVNPAPCLTLPSAVRSEGGLKMTHRFLKTIGALAALALIASWGMSTRVTRVLANDDKDRDREREESRIQIGFQIAPIHLNLSGKNLALVGLGSYIVNAQSGCNGCHNPGPGGNEFLPSGNPYFGLPKQINRATYLGGGRNFGPLMPGSANIISRNLTPDKTGRPVGGDTLAEFTQIMRTGADPDQLHPTCPVGTVNTGCVPKPFDGNLLQIMPWTAYQDMTDRDLKAIYEYLSAIPCVEGPPAPSPLHHDC
jgi:hypothetical protein